LNFLKLEFTFLNSQKLPPQKDIGKDMQKDMQKDITFIFKKIRTGFEPSYPIQF